MLLRQSDALRNAKAAQVTALLDAGSGPGVAEIREGEPPATPADAPTGLLLATVTLAKPAFDDPAAGVAELFDPASVDGTASGTAGWVRFKDSDGVAVFDGDVSDIGGTGMMRLLSLVIVEDEPVDVAGGSWTEPM